MPSTLTTSMQSSPSFRPNSCVPSTSGQDADGQGDSRQDRFNRLREYVRTIDNRSDVERHDPYKLFVGLCRQFHGHRTKKGHSFRARRLRWLWRCSEGNNGAFENLWTAESTERTRQQDDELAITVRCLSGGFTQAETEAVIKAWWEHHGEGFDFMSMIVFRATSLARALVLTAGIREQRQTEAKEKYWSKTASRILWVLEKAGDAGATPKQIAEMIQRGVDLVKHSLSRLCKRGQVEKIRHGLYRPVVEQECEAVSALVPQPEAESEIPFEPTQMELGTNVHPHSGEVVHCAVQEEIPSAGEETQANFLESVLVLDDEAQAEVAIRDRFYKQARDYADGRSNSCPKNILDQLAAFRSAWIERHSDAGGSM